MKVGDLVKDISGVMGVVLVTGKDFTKTTFGWANTKHLEVITAAKKNE